jgi:hypothetical protein
MHYEHARRTPHLDLDRLADAAIDALHAESKRLDAEQSPRGLDALDELAIHPVLRKGLASTGAGVLAEQRYPADRARRRRSEGDRCDIVLTPDPNAPLHDPVSETPLFEDRALPPDAALWIEVKIAGQFSIIDAEARPNRGYSQRLLTGALADVRRLTRADTIRHAAMLLVLFTQDEAAAEHDVHVWANRCLSKGLNVAPPILRGRPITERIGNAWAAVALARVRG